MASQREALRQFHSRIAARVTSLFGGPEAQVRRFVLSQTSRNVSLGRGS